MSSSPSVLEERDETERARVVVEAVAVLVAGHVEAGVLEDARVVRHRAQVVEARLGELGGPPRERPGLKDAASSVGVLGHRARSKVAT